MVGGRRTTITSFLLPSSSSSLGRGTRQGALRRVRTDALPEHTRYRDDGCNIYSHCLTCPLPRCRYDEPGGLRTLLNAYRDQRIMELRREGVAVEELAQRFQISRRTVFRVLEKGNGNKEPALSKAKGADNGHH